MGGVLAAALVTMSWQGVASASSHVALEPERREQQDFITRAVFARERLWTLADSGALLSTSEHDVAVRRETLPEPAFDLCRDRATPVIATGARAGGDEWHLRRLEGDEWKIGASVPTRGERFIALACEGGRFTILTDRRVITISDNGQQSLMLVGKLRGGLVTSLHRTPASLYVGVNAGEWGGGLARISLADGSVIQVARNESGGLCEGPLNSDCDPVNGVVAIPWKPGCVAVAIGMVHFMPRGRVVEVCGVAVTSLYAAKITGPALVHTAGQPELAQDEAFFGITRVGSDLWAVGLTGIYLIGADRRAVKQPLPAFVAHGPIRASFALPEAVLVYTSVNARASVGGAVPLIVPR